MTLCVALSCEDAVRVGVRTLWVTLSRVTRCVRVWIQRPGDMIVSAAAGHGQKQPKSWTSNTEVEIETFFSLRRLQRQKKTSLKMKENGAFLPLHAIFGLLEFRKTNFALHRTSSLMTHWIWYFMFAQWRFATPESAKDVQVPGLSWSTCST